MVLFGILLFALLSLSWSDLGDSCGKNLTGTCVLVSDCKSATDSLKKKRQHGLERCGFKGSEEIVCCLDSQDLGLKNPDKIRKSEVACNSFKNEIIILPFIIGGENATLGEFPHMAALGYEDETRDDYNFECGGSLISDSYVLTAAHCLVRIDNKVPKIVRFGKIDLLGNEDGAKPQDVTVADIFPHENYVWQDKINDIGIIRLTRSVETTGYISPICLYTEESDPVDLVVAGWGKTGNTRDGSRFLLKTQLSPVDLKECNITIGRRAFGKPVFTTHLCAKSNDTVPRDTCEGDSGGPMQSEERRNNISSAFLVGVTSYGPLCGGTLPSIYTRVSKYLDWIEEIVWP